VRILELTNYSAGGCGVYARVREEAQLLAKKGHEVRIFSSNRVKGSKEMAQRHDSIGNVKITRFKARQRGGESYLKWDFEKEALEYNPDIVIAHSYRHLHTTEIIRLREKKRLKCKIFLVTHAPFDRDATRNIISKLSVWIYDNSPWGLGKSTLKKFDKIIAITKWERPYLHKLGVPDSKIVYIPNGIPDILFKAPKKIKEEHKIIFIGRVAPIKQIETVIDALPLLKDKEITFEIVGPAEKEYLTRLKRLIADKDVEKRVIFTDAIYDMREKINKLDSATFFILPSKSEGMPQSLIEAMARKKIVVASENPASKDLIVNGKNGFLYKNGNEQDCARVLDAISALSQKEKKAIQDAALRSVRRFSWDKIIEDFEKIFKSSIEPL